MKSDRGTIPKAMAPEDFSRVFNLTHISISPSQDEFLIFGSSFDVSRNEAYGVFAEKCLKFLSSRGVLLTVYGDRILVEACRSWLDSVINFHLNKLAKDIRGQFYIRFVQTLLNEMISEDSMDLSEELMLNIFDLGEIYHMVGKEMEKREPDFLGLHSSFFTPHGILRELYPNEIAGVKFADVFQETISYVPFFVHLKSLEMNLGELSIPMKMAVLRGGNLT